MANVNLKPEKPSSRRSFLEKISLGIAAAVLPLPISTNALSIPDPHTPSMNTGTKIFIPVMLTAYHENGSIDYDGMSRLMDFYLASGAKGFFANCLSSEMYQLTDEEKVTLTKFVVDYVGGKQPVVSSGSFGETVQAKADFSKRIHDTGIDSVILISAHFAEKQESDSVLLGRLDEFLRQTAEIPLGTYECPTPYKRIITPEIMTFMVGSGRFVYHKDTTEDIDQIKAKIDLMREGQPGIYNAHIGSAAQSLQYGCAGLSPIAGNFYPEIITWLCDNATDPTKKADVDWLQQELREAEQLIGNQYQLGARYFLAKRGCSVSMVSRSTPGSLSSAQREVLDNLLLRLDGWHERLGI